MEKKQQKPAEIYQTQLDIISTALSKIRPIPNDRDRAVIVLAEIKNKYKLVPVR